MPISSTHTRLTSHYLEDMDTRNHPFGLRKTNNEQTKLDKVKKILSGANSTRYLTLPNEWNNYVINHIWNDGYG